MTTLFVIEPIQGTHDTDLLNGYKAGGLKPAVKTIPYALRILYNETF